MKLMNEFTIASTDICFENYSKIYKFTSYNFYSRNTKFDINSVNICFDGYILPRHNIFNEYKNLNSKELIFALYQKYKLDFIQYVKGNFCIVIFEKGKFYIFTDQIGIKKVFYWQNGNDFIISNNLKNITKNIKAEVSTENIAIYALTYHFVGGTTIFKNINYNQPAQIIDYKDGKLNFSKYWEVGELLNSEKQNINISGIANHLISNINNYLEFYKNENISLSLTGGADTRNILSVFLNLGYKPHLYTYGNPLSSDCKKAKAIADGLRLKHNIYDMKMSSRLFKEEAKKIINLGNSLASIHRVHRLLAVQKEKLYANVMFLGTLGGEFIKGVSEDNYIVPSIVYENWNNKALTNDIIKHYLSVKDIKQNNIDLNYIKEFLNSEPYLNGDFIKRKFHTLTSITARLHDAQDVNLYETVMDYVFTPFLDIDYLELIFSSNYTFNNKAIIKNKYLRRIENPFYASNFIKCVYPELLKYKYSGEHKPKEVIFNKYYAALIKIIRQKTKPTYPQNFPLNSWMLEFVNEELPKCMKYEILKNTFELDSLIKEVNLIRNKTIESYWLKFTNPIMMKYILDEYFYE